MSPKVVDSHLHGMPNIIPLWKGLNLPKIILDAPELSSIFPGQFMIVATIEKGARIPRPRENMATASGNATSTV